MNRKVLGSMTRIADFETVPYNVEALSKSEWAAGDYVEAEVTGTPTELYLSLIHI